jgi:hypothetical protein
VTGLRQGRLTRGGLTLGAPQIHGAIRLVPVRRSEPLAGIAMHTFEPPEHSGEGRLVRIVGHGLAFTTNTLEPSTVFGTRLGVPRRSDVFPLGARAARLFRRDAAQGGAHFRFLRLQIALEGYLCLAARGPEVAFAEYTAQALRSGAVMPMPADELGMRVRGLRDALRVFELYDDQVGVLVYAADVFASAFVVPTSADYRRLHASLVLDLFGELIHQYAFFHHAVNTGAPSIDEASVRSLEDLRAAVSAMRAVFGSQQEALAAGLLETELRFERLHATRGFTLERFVPSFDPSSDNHVGEQVVGPGGELAYLSTYRLSAAQTKRGYLLSRLVDLGWELSPAAEALGTDVPGVLLRLKNAGFGYLIKPHVLAEAQRAQKRATRPS